MDDNISVQTIRTVFRKGQPLVYAKHNLIPNDDPTHRGVYLIDSGYVKVYSISDDGEEYVHVVWGAGEVFPLAWAAVETPADTQLFYEALSECLVWRLSRDWLMYFIGRNFGVSNAMAVQLALQVDVLADRIDNLEHRKADKRLAYHLLFLAERFGIRQGETIVIDAPMTHELLASSVNLARESVSRVFERLVEEGTIGRVGNRIIIRDAPQLMRHLASPSNIEAWQLP